MKNKIKRSKETLDHKLKFDHALVSGQALYNVFSLYDTVYNNQIQNISK